MTPKSVTVLQSPKTLVEKALNEYNLRQSFHDSARLEALLEAVRNEERHRCADVARDVALGNEGAASECDRLAIECDREDLHESTWYRDAAKIARRLEESIRRLAGAR